MEAEDQKTLRAMKEVLLKNFNEGYKQEPSNNEERAAINLATAETVRAFVAVVKALN